MGVLDGEAVSAAVTNPAFINKNINDMMPNVLGLGNSNSPTIADIQAATNRLYTATGASESTTGTNYNATSGTIFNGQNYQTALTTLANKFDALTGHMHTGTAGDGPLLANVVTGIGISGGTFQTGNVSLVAGSGITLTAPTGGGIEFQSSGVGSVAASGFAALTGNIIFEAGSGILITQSGQDIEISSSVTGSVLSIAATGHTGLTGNVVLQAGTGISLSQSGQDIMISASGSGSNMMPTLQTFATSGTYNLPSPSPFYIVVTAYGPGGGGGGGSTASAGAGGAGGSQGGIAIKKIAATAITGAITVTIGTGGSGGAGGNPGSAGNNGSGSTSFGTFVIATAGGGGGAGQNLQTPGTATAPGVGITGDLLFQGGPGEGGTAGVSGLQGGLGGIGGGPGGIGGAPGASGGMGGNYGGGGGGGGGSAHGGTANNGFVSVEEFYE